MGHILRLIVCGVKIVDATNQACVHDGQVLIGESHIDYELRFVAVEKLHKLRHAVSVDNIRRDIRFPDSIDNCIAFRACARSDNYFSENFRVLGALVGHYGAHTAGSNDNNFCHLFYCNLIVVFSCLVSLTAEEAQQIEEQVDEVEV